MTGASDEHQASRMTLTGTLFVFTTDCCKVI
jgi:hypothetical protein